VKDSGYGREMGTEGLLEYTWTHQINDRQILG
jgi:aldehyde dehydrogenase